MRIKAMVTLTILMMLILTACFPNSEMDPGMHVVETSASVEESSPIDETVADHSNNGEGTEDEASEGKKTKEEAPTGYPMGEIQAELIFVNERLYVRDDNAQNGGHLPEGYEMVGEITSVENIEEPDQNFEASHVDIGTEIYGNASDTKYIYGKRPEADHYGQFIAATETGMWWRGKDVNNQ